MPFVVGDVQFRISADDRKLLSDLAEAERAARRSAQNIQSSLGGINLGGAARFGLQVAGLGVGFSAAQAAAEGLHKVLDGTIGSGIRLSASLETATLQFQTLMGSADAAEAHVRDLFQFAAATPFAAEETIAASRNLRTLGGAALDTAPNLKLVGDAAAATSSGIQEVAFWTARAYSQIQAGRPFGEAAQRLQELGILSGTTRNQLEALQKSGASSSQIWETFAGGLQRFEGAMKRQADTFDGLTSTLSDNLAQISAIATRPIFEGLKDAIRDLNETLSSKETQQNASIFAITLERIGLMASNSAGNVDLLDQRTNQLLQTITNNQGLLGLLFGAAGPQIAGPQAGTIQNVGPAIGGAESSIFETLDRHIGRTGQDLVDPERRRAESAANRHAEATKAEAQAQLEAAAAAAEHAKALEKMVTDRQVAAAAADDERMREHAIALAYKDSAAAVVEFAIAQERRNTAIRDGVALGQALATANAPSLRDEFHGGAAPFDPNQEERPGEIDRRTNIRESIASALAAAKPRDRAALAAALQGQGGLDTGLILRDIQADPVQQAKDAITQQQAVIQQAEQARDQRQREADQRQARADQAHVEAVRAQGQASVEAAQTAVQAERDRHEAVMDQLRDEAEARQETARQRQAQLAIDQQEIAAARAVTDARERLSDAETAAARAQSGLGRPGDARRTQGQQAEQIRTAQKAVEDARKAAQEAALGQGVTALEAAGLGNAGILSQAEQAAQVARLREQLAARAQAGLLTADEQRQAEEVLALASRPRASLTPEQRAAVDRALSTALRQEDEAAQRKEREEQRTEDRLNRENTERLQQVVKDRQKAAEADTKAAEKMASAAREQRENADAWARILRLTDQDTPAGIIGPVVAPPSPAAGGASAPGGLPPGAPVAGAGGVSVQVIYQAPVTIGGGMDLQAFTNAQVTAIKEGIRRVGG